MTNTEKRIVFIRNFAELTRTAKAMGIEFIITASYRTKEQQYEMYINHKSQLDGMNKRSKHQSWLAIDICIIKNGECIWTRTAEYNALGEAWKELGGIWGGDWKGLNDIYHFEYSDGLNKNNS